MSLDTKYDVDPILPSYSLSVYLPIVMLEVFYAYFDFPLMYAAYTVASNQIGRKTLAADDERRLGLSQP